MISQYFMVRSYYVSVVMLFAIQNALARSPKPVVTFTSECSCENDHADSRWQAKIDSAEPPTDLSQIRQLTPSDIYDWKGPGVPISRKQERLPAEQQWYVLTGRVIAVRAEEDGDIHLVLDDAVGNKVGKVIVELPLEARWCAMRTTVFSWTNAAFPFETRRGNNFSPTHPYIVRAVGKAFYDVDHAGKNTQNNQRAYDRSLAVWEIHPVMKLEVIDSGALPVARHLGNQSTPSLPAAAATQTPTVPQYVTITAPVTIAIPYGKTVIPRGSRLRVISRSQDSVTVQFMDGTYSVPLSSTDLR